MNPPSSRRRPPTEPCLNCGDPTPGEFCPACGQRKANLASLGELLKDGLEDQLLLNRKLPRTLGALLFRPGLLSDEYVRGRVVRYIPPLRLYLVASVLMFLVVSLVGLQALSTVEVGGPAVSADTDMADGTLQAWARSITFEGRTGWLERAMARKVQQLGHLPPREAFEALLSDLLVYAPHMMFLLLPLYALLLKALYVTQDRYYAEHFIFALHVHAFVFAAWTLIFVVPWGVVRLMILLSILAYTWLAMRRFYRDGKLLTTMKWWTLGFLYFFVFLTGLVGLALATLLLT